MGFQAAKRWASAPLVIARGVYALELIGLIALGLAIWLASSPVMDVTVGDGLQAVWGIALSVSAAVTFIGILSPKFENIEGWGTLGLAALLIGYAIFPFQLVLAGDLDRLVYSIIAAVLSFIPLARAWTLLKRFLLRKTPVREGKRG